MVDQEDSGDHEREVAQVREDAQEQEGDQVRQDAQEHENDLPEETVDEVERLTRLARRAVDEDEAAAYRDRRDDLLAEYGFTDRIREGNHGDVLVCYPEEWVDEGGVVDTESIEDVDRAAEVPLDGPGDPDEWDAVHERNLELSDRVEAQHGDVHGANARALAEFAGNHYAKPIEALSAEAIEEFRTDYYERNVWPTDDQAAALEESLDLVFEAASVPHPVPQDGTDDA